MSAETPQEDARKLLAVPFGPDSRWEQEAREIIERLADALDRLEQRLARLEEALQWCGRHLEDCCRSDIGWEEAMASHNDAVNACADAERALDAAEPEERA